MVGFVRVQENQEEFEVKGLEIELDLPPLSIQEEDWARPTLVRKLAQKTWIQK